MSAIFHPALGGIGNVKRILNILCMKGFSSDALSILIDGTITPPEDFF